MKSLIFKIFFFWIIFIFPTILNAQISDSYLDRLDKGEIIVESVDDSTGLPGIKAMFQISGSRTEIWGMLNDFENYKEIYGNIDSLEVIEADSNGVVVEFWSDAVIKKINFVLKRNYDIYGQKLSWRKLSGDMKRIEGGWEIIDSRDPGEKILIYRTFVKYGGIVPTKLIRRGAKKKAKEMGSKLRNWMQQNRHLYN